MPISGHTKLICLLGSPIAHSLSPAMHNVAFQAQGLDYSYMAFDVKPETLSEIVPAFKAMHVRGMNLTMPLKNDIIPMCDHISDAARISGSVNTIVFEDDGTMSGHTTDGTGFFMACRDEGFEIKDKKMTLLGTGGAGTAILVQAALDGAKSISVFARKSSRFIGRTIEVIEELKKSTGVDISLYDYTDEDMKRELGDTDLLCNASNVGMSPQVDACLIDDFSWLPDTCTVVDVIYEPAETKLLKLARERGLRAFNGMYMLLYQGAAAYKLWTGLDMPVELVKKEVFNDR